MYIDKACPVYNRDILKHCTWKGIKRRGHAEQHIKATLDEESSWNKALTELKTCSPLHGRYEHATLKTNRKELFDVKALFQVSQIKRGPRLFDTPSVTFDLKQNTFFFIYIYIYIYLLKRHLSIYCTPSVHENILGTFAFQHTAAFHYKKVVWTQTLWTQQMKSMTYKWRIENFFLFKCWYCATRVNRSIY